MLPSLKKGYSLILDYANRKGIHLTNKKDVIAEIGSIESDIESDIRDFNHLISELDRTKNDLSIDEIEERWILIRVKAMNISTEFDNFVDSFEEAFRQK